MSAWSDALKQGFKEARRVAGVDFVISGSTYRGIQSDTTDLVNLASGGFGQDYDAGLDYLPEEIDPAIGSLLSMGGVSYRVKDKRHSGDNPVATVMLQGANK